MRLPALPLAARLHALGPASRQWRARLAAALGALALALVAILFARCGEWAQALFHQFESRWPLATLAATPALFMALVWLTRRHWP
ncbi:MAG TPA: chloride channel protein, partial [Novosphingobium sp.]|nr:chloride channel protein [Novosphingobium sp.]